MGQPCRPIVIDFQTNSGCCYPYLASGKETTAKLDLMWISWGTEDTDLTGIEDFTAIMEKNGVN
jgi:hypothetical protein